MKQEEVMRIQEEVQAKDDETRRLQEEVEAARKRQEEVANALISATTMPAHHHLEDEDDDDQAMPNGHSHEFASGEGDYLDPVDGRRTAAEKNSQLQSKLQVCFIFTLYNSRRIQNTIIYVLIVSDYFFPFLDVESRVGGDS